MSAPEPPVVSAENVVAELQERVRERLRRELLQQGGSSSLEDAALFARVDSMLRGATSRTPNRTLLLHEYLGDPATWRLEPALRLDSHRGALPARLLIGVKRRILLPVLRWLFDYTHDNFVRQRRVNEALFAVVQELAIQNAELRRDLDRLKST